MVLIYQPPTQCACANFVDLIATQRNGGRSREKDLYSKSVRPSSIQSNTKRFNAAMMLCYIWHVYYMYYSPAFNKILSSLCRIPMHLVLFHLPSEIFCSFLVQYLKYKHDSVQRCIQISRKAIMCLCRLICLASNSERILILMQTFGDQIITSTETNTLQHYHYYILTKSNLKWREKWSYHLWWKKLHHHKSSAGDNIFKSIR
jgi:hypothetical protein